MAKNKTENIGVFIPDNINANRGTLSGRKMIEQSFKELGSGRSILVDKNNRIIAGNKSIAAAVKNGITKVVIVETTGNKIVAVKRTDLDLDSQKGREMAIADNMTQQENLEWNYGALSYIDGKYGVSSLEWGVSGMEAWQNKDVRAFKPNTNPTTESGLTSQRDVEAAQASVDEKIEHRKQSHDTKTFICPNCGKEVTIDRYE